MGVIYYIKNKKNGKIYIGQTVRPNERFKKHKWELERNMHPNEYLQNAWNKYGENAFEYGVLGTYKNEKLNGREIYWIKRFDALNPEKGYNLQSGGNSNFKPSKKTRKKISNAKKGEKHHMWGKKHKPSTIKKISDAGRKRKQTEYTKQKLSKLRSGENNPFYNKHHSQEDRIRMSKIHSSTGYYRVYKQKKDDVNQGFIWVYQYYDENKKRKRLSSVDLAKLKQKVIDNGFIWLKLSDDVEIDV